MSIKLSEKSALIPPSPIRKLAPYAHAAMQKGINVYKLNIGQPDIGMPDCALNAIRSAKINNLPYTNSAGTPSYIEALAQYYSKRGHQILPDELVVTNGGSEAIYFALLAICNPGDEVIIPEPYYANYNGFTIQVGAKIVPITTHIEDGFALPAIEEFEKIITPRTKAIMICNPNNPTGKLYSEQEICQLKEIVIKHDIFLIADEVYSDFCYDGEKHTSLLELDGIDDRVIICDSVSKRYSMCGARVGAIISKNVDLMDTVMRLAQTRLSAPFLDQLAAEAALRYTDEHYFENVKKEYISRRDTMVKLLREIDGVVCPTPKGAFYVVAKLPVDNSEVFSQWMLENFSLNGETLMLAPAAGFYADPNNCPQNYVRLAYVLCNEDIKKSLNILKHALEEYNKIKSTK